MIAFKGKGKLMPKNEWVKKCKCDCNPYCGCDCHKTALNKEDSEFAPFNNADWKKDVEVLREEFEELFPKDEEAKRGIRPSRSNRSAGLFLWAKWKMITDKAIDEAVNRDRERSARLVEEYIFGPNDDDDHLRRIAADIRSGRPIENN